MTTKIQEYDASKVYRSTWGKGEREKRNENAQEISKTYYDLVTATYESGWSDHFHFCRFKPGESIEEGLIRHERFLALMTEIKPGMKVLDLGSGIGRPAFEIATFTGAHVTGVNLNRAQLARSRRDAKAFGLSGLVDFVEADFTKMPFEDNTFDVVYAIEATCHAPTLESVYREALRVLKPGGRFGTYEFIMSDKYIDSDALHQDIRSRIEEGAGCPTLTTSSQALESLKRAGFEVLYEEDRAPPDEVYSVPWWYAINGDLRYAVNNADRHKIFLMKESVHHYIMIMARFLLRFGLVTEEVIGSTETISMGVFAMRDGGKMGIFTSQYLMIGKKPLVVD